MSDEHPITAQEMQELFGETMPIEAADLLWNSPDTMTIGEVRAAVREFACAHNARIAGGER